MVSLQTLQPTFLESVCLLSQVICGVYGSQQRWISVPREHESAEVEEFLTLLATDKQGALHRTGCPGT